uniref:Proliferating cell nuclear antigen PCNA N-terminal domain-containing protein n=1 Tax=viral metagenome TaxID=1070528 RepID=A0A6C0J666_9ZZZZ
MGINNVPDNEDSVVEFRTSQIRPIRQLFESIKNKLPDTSLLFHPECMKILQVDTAQTFLVDVKLHGENFDHYYCNPGRGESEQQHIEINLNAENLNAVFKSVTKEDQIFTFTYKYKSNHVELEFHNPKKKEVKCFVIPIQNPENDDDFTEITPAMIDEYSYRMSMLTSDLTSICKTLKNINCDSMQIRHDTNTLKFSSTGDTRGNIIRTGTTYSEKEDDEQLTFIKVPTGEGPYSGKFKFSTFYEFSKSQGNGDNKIVQILLEKDKPIILHYEIGTLGEMYIAMAAFEADDDDEDDDDDDDDENDFTN